jgi:secondary thiamine-phosphate synthase enzyme
MEQSFADITVKTNGPGFMDMTQAIARSLDAMQAGDGLLTVFLRHTSASLTIQENADPAVQRDLLEVLDAIAPRDRAWMHATEGPDDMPAHVKAMLTSVSLSIPVRSGRMVLGIWQGIYLIEHRDAPHAREIVLHFVGTTGR